LRGFLAVRANVMEAFSEVSEVANLMREEARVE
jgi:hypothetical protein